MTSTEEYSTLYEALDEISVLRSIIENKYSQTESIHENVPLSHSNFEETLLEFELKRDVTLPKSMRIMTEKLSSAETEIKIGYEERYQSTVENKFNNMPEVVSKRYYVIIIDFRNLYLQGLILNRQKNYDDSIIEKDYDKF